MFPLNKKVNPELIFEFKVSKKSDDESMEKAVNEALNQIKDKEYEVEMQQHKVKDVLNLEIAFNGKKVKVKLG